MTEEIRRTRAEREQTGGSPFGRTFLKQLLAASVIIGLVYLSRRLGNGFVNNCTEALGRAVRHEFEWGAVLGALRGYAESFGRFWSEVF